MTASERLRVMVKPLTPVERAPLERAGIETRLTRRAALGQPSNASTHLRICALTGLDPVTGLKRPPFVAGELFWPSLGAALRMRRIEQGDITLRQAGKQARMSYTAIGRIERAEPVSIDAVLAACRWLGRHPFDFVSPDISRELGRAA